MGKQQENTRSGRQDYRAYRANRVEGMGMSRWKDDVLQYCNREPAGSSMVGRQNIGQSSALEEHIPAHINELL